MERPLWWCNNKHGKLKWIWSCSQWNLTTSGCYWDDTRKSGRGMKNHRVKKKEEAGLRGDGAKTEAIPSEWSTAACLTHQWEAWSQRVLTPSRQLLGVDYLCSILLPRGNLHAPPHHRERTPTGHNEAGISLCTTRLFIKYKGTAVKMTPWHLKCFLLHLHCVTRTSESPSRVSVSQVHRFAFQDPFYNTHHSMVILKHSPLVTFQRAE